MIVRDFAKAGLILMGFYYLPVLILEWWTKGEHAVQRISRAPWFWQTSVYAYLILMIIIFQAEENVGFIYFAF